MDEWECWVDTGNASGISEQGEQLSVSVVHLRESWPIIFIKSCSSQPE